MMKRMLMLMAAIALGPKCTNAYVYPASPGCPEFDQTHQRHWRNYFMHQYDVPTFHNTSFSIKFDQNIGNIAGGRCYTVLIVGADGWTTSGYSIAQGHSAIGTYGGTNPTTFKMNIWGVVLTYDEHANVFYNGAVVGHMRCYLVGPTC